MARDSGRNPTPARPATESTQDYHQTRRQVCSSGLGISNPGTASSMAIGEASVWLAGRRIDVAIHPGRAGSDEGCWRPRYLEIRRLDSVRTLRQGSASLSLSSGCSIFRRDAGGDVEAPARVLRRPCRLEPRAGPCDALVGETHTKGGGPARLDARLGGAERRRPARAVAAGRPGRAACTGPARRAGRGAADGGGGRDDDGAGRRVRRLRHARAVGGAVAAGALRRGLPGLPGGRAALGSPRSEAPPTRRSAPVPGRPGSQPPGRGDGERALPLIMTWRADERAVNNEG